MSHSNVDWSLMGDTTSETTAVNAQEAEPWYVSIAKTVTPVIANTYQQTQLTKLNVQRMQQGLPALTAAEYASTYQVPAAQVQVGMDANTRQLLIWAGIGLAGFLVLRSMRAI